MKNPIRKIIEDSREYGIPIWRMPDVLLILMALTNCATMILTYVWAVKFVRDPREAVILVAAESVIIVIFGNILVESSKRFMELSRLKREFVQIISHQMRTPLTTIKWYLEIFEETLKKDKVTPKQEEFIGKIKEENEKMRSMINEMINLSRIKAFSEIFEKQEVDLEKMVSECFGIVEGYAGTKDIDLKLKDQTRDEVQAKVNRDDLKIILINLIENAINYSKKGSTVVVTISQVDGKFEVRVKDRGIGVSEADRKFIFNQFFRSDDARKMKPEGTGLGLFLSKQLADKMKGRIDFESEPQKGSEFFLTFPAR